MSYVSGRGCFLQVLQVLRIKTKFFSRHSLRLGGASAAANTRVTDRLFKQHGKWKSKSVKKGCVKDILGILTEAPLLLAHTC